MPFRLRTLNLDKSAGPFRRSLQYAFCDWTREMPRPKRIVTYVGIVLQGYALYFMLMWAFMLPKWLYAYFLVLPRRPVSYVLVFLLYYTGYHIQNGMLTSEFVRKTQLETDQIAARQIQQTLQPGKLEELPGYDVKTPGSSEPVPLSEYACEVLQAWNKDQASKSPYVFPSPVCPDRPISTVRQLGKPR